MSARSLAAALVAFIALWAVAARAAPPAAAEQPAAGAPAALPEAKPLRSSATPSGSGTYSLGEPFTVEIAVDHAAQDTYSFPAKPALAGLTLRGEVTTARAATAEGAQTKFVLQLVNFSTLTPEVPPFTLLVNGPQGPRVFTVPGRKLALRSLVSQEGEGSFEHAHHGPKPPVRVAVRSLLWLGLLFGLAALAAAAVLVRRELLRRRARALFVPVVRISADEEAIARLAALSRRAPWKSGLGRQAIFEVSEIVRGYLGKRLEFDALDLTSDELKTKLEARPLPGLELPAYFESSRWDDLVKFAKLEPTPAECEAAVERALTLVTRTRKAQKDALAQAQTASGAAAFAPGAAGGKAA